MRINTERLVLKPLGMDHFLTAHKYLADAENTLYMKYLPHEDEAETIRFLTACEAEWQKVRPAYYEFAVFLGETHIGGVALYNDTEERETGELVWIIDKNYWGKGYAAEAAKKLVDFGAEQLGLKRIIARCDSNNRMSKRIMEKLGMKHCNTIPGRKNRGSDEIHEEYEYELLFS
ncbi:MAG: GNAT family N-acetyltransferase [Lachnospiraceae bacterium]|nr:GNAT family N-acetyltransferase [Lachnospiraceae bacterium]